MRVSKRAFKKGEEARRHELSKRMIGGLKTPWELGHLGEGGDEEDLSKRVLPRRAQGGDLQAFK